MSDPNPNPATPPPATPPAPDAGTPPATPPATPPPASLEAIQAELEKVRAEREIERLRFEKEAHKEREARRKDRELLDNFRKLVGGTDPAAGDDPKVALERQAAEAARREKEEALKERAVLRRLVGTNLEPGVVDLVAPALMRAVSIGETGDVIGLDEAFKGLEPILGKLSGKAAPAAPALPNPPNPGAAARPLDPVFAKVTTFRAYVDLPIAAQERFKAEHPDVFSRIYAEHEARLARAGH